MSFLWVLVQREKKKIDLVSYPVRTEGLVNKISAKRT